MSINMNRVRRAYEIDPDVKAMLLQIGERLTKIEGRFEKEEKANIDELEKEYEAEGIRPNFASIRVNKNGEKLSKHLRLEIAKNDAMKYVQQLDKLEQDFRTSYHLAIAGLQEKINAISSDKLE